VEDVSLAVGYVLYMCVCVCVWCLD